MKKIIKIFMILLVAIATLCLAVFLFMSQPKFGRLPSGERLERIKKSSHYHNGQFENIEATPLMINNSGPRFSLIKDFLLAKNKPDTVLPSVKTDLLHLNPAENTLVWFGHSSYFMQIAGKRILVDPIFSNRASPVPFTVQAFTGSNIYSVSDLPEIDYLFITHDHWDHLDCKTIKQLKTKVKKVICGLGVGEDFEFWGYDKAKIVEVDWGEAVTLDDGFKINSTPARHFSGRAFTRNQTVWTSYALQSPIGKIFMSSDSGYGRHFVEIGKSYGPFDLAILDDGQYDESWRNVHMFPDQVLQASKDLGAKRILPIHFAKFILARHSWNEPIEKLSELVAQDKSARLLTPMIGEKVSLWNDEQVFSQWWMKN